jgi:hypothetical protein
MIVARTKEEKQGSSYLSVVDWKRGILSMSQIGTIPIFQKKGYLSTE